MRNIEISKFPPLSYSCAEAVNTLCTNLSFSGENVKKIMITSCHASEGKSFLSMNIMRTFAKFGKNVVFVDTDLRRSKINSRYGIHFDGVEEKEGLAHFLAGMADEKSIVYQTNIAGAYFVPIGRIISNPLPLLNSPRFEQLLTHLSEEADYVIIDAPPVGTVIDAAQIAKSCDGILIAVGYNSVRRQELIDTKTQLEQTGCPILGTVLNQVLYDDYLSRKYYYRSYGRYSGYYTAPDEEQGNGKKSKRRK